MWSWSTVEVLKLGQGVAKGIERLLRGYLFTAIPTVKSSQSAYHSSEMFEVDFDASYSHQLILPVTKHTWRHNHS
jgi:hypothetical protein